LLRGLQGYAWPGNLRELSNYAVSCVLSGNAREMAEDLQRRAYADPAHAQQLPLREQVRRAARELESGIILRTLQNHRWNRGRTAESLHISYRSLLYKMKSCRLSGAEVPEGRPA
jgi:two-component system, NtrC family, response regulator AtoC